MERDRFEALVDKALNSLPPSLLQRMENIALMVEDWPSGEQLKKSKIRHPRELLGLYEGIPLPNRTSGYNMVLPDRITIFQNPIEQLYRTDAKIVEKIQDTVYHEIAHYFGISDSRLRQMGKY